MEAPLNELAFCWLQSVCGWGRQSVSELVGLLVGWLDGWLFGWWGSAVIHG